MAADPSVSLRLINNERLRRSLGPSEYRDLGGALAITSDAPIGDLNHIEAFTTDDARIESLLDIGFALLRAFDREPAALLTPLDRPASLAERLRRRGLAPGERSLVMAYGGGGALRTNGEVEVRRAGSDNAATFAAIVSAGAPKWVRELVFAEVTEGLHEPGNTFYVATLEGEPAGVLHLLRDGATAGIYALATRKAQRRRGVCSTLLTIAIADAEAAGCDVIGLRTAPDGDARRLFERAGFAPVHEAVLWTAPAAG